jgi:uncharacterized membrane protein (DUF2068 family)
MRLAYVIAGFASLVGVVAVGIGLHGLYKLDFTEWAMTMGRAFDNPEYGNIKADEWRTGYQASMAVFISFGLAALVAAYGLLRKQRWAEYLWLLLVAIHIIVPIQELPSRLSAWVWLTVSATIFAASLFAFRTRSTGVAP